MSLDDYILLIKTALQKKYESIILGELTTALPVPFLLPIYKKLASYFAEKIAADNEMRAFFVYTDLRVSKQGRDFLDALKKNKSILFESKDEQIRAAAEKLVIDNFRALARFSN